uniref:Putative Xaa-Pro aminopeptidase pepP n=1 Tax=Lygus hesperus TaxID=30085 RepID=A0A0A9XBR3_LYGHE
MNVSYIGLTNIGVAITQNTAARIIVVVDAQDGANFAKLIANETLSTFTARFIRELENHILTPNTFLGFSYDVGDVIYNSVRPVLDHLALQRGIVLALLATSQDNRLLHSTLDVDKITALANHARILDSATEVLGGSGIYDQHTVILMKNRKTTLTIYRIERYSLTVVTKNKAQQSECRKYIDEALSSIRKLLVVANNVSGRTIS